MGHALRPKAALSYCLLRPQVGDTPLLDAAEKGYMPMALALLEHGADPNARRLDFEGARHPGATALYLAACTGQTAVVRLLLDHGADVLAQTKVNAEHGASLAALLGSHAQDVPGGKLLQLCNQLRCSGLFAGSGHCIPRCQAAWPR